MPLRRILGDRPRRHWLSGMFCPKIEIIETQQEAPTERSVGWSLRLCVCSSSMKMGHPPPKPEDTHPTNSGKCVVVDLFLALTTRLGTIRSNIIVEGRRLFIGSEGGCFFDLLEEEVATRGHREVFK